MPEPHDLSRDLSTQLQRSTGQGWASRCYNCGSGVKSEIYNTCAVCFDVFQDVKPGSADQKPSPALRDIWWKSTAEIPPAPAPTPATAKASRPEHVDDIVDISFGSSSGSPVKRFTRSRSSPTEDQDHGLAHARTSPRRSSAALYRQPHGQRGRPPNGSRVGPVGYKGVRQRKGVRGFLVEIRPPKWKKTIWLGTYNTDREAAGAYDAGIFYTNKKTKYNFPTLEDTFPALPVQLRLDHPDDAEEIKTFVQREARDAARKAKTLPAPPLPLPSPSPSPPEPATSNTSYTNIATSSSEDSEEIALTMNPEDEEWFQMQLSGYSAWLDFSSLIPEDLLDVMSSELLHPLP